MHLIFDFNIGEVSSRAFYLKVNGDKKYDNLYNIVNYAIGMFMLLMNGSTPDKIEFEGLKRKLSLVLGRR